MTLYFNVKSLSRKDRFVQPIPYTFPAAPTTLEGLIRAVVQQEVAAYNRRLTDTAPQLPSAAETADTARHGKISFGLGFGDTPADEAAAIQTALAGFSDGLYRIFRNNTELTDLNAPLPLQEGDSFTIIRLVMLTGGLF